MRQFMQAVLERRNEHSQSFGTHPYETAWASEAIFFVKIHEVSGAGAEVKATVQVSPDGLDWVNEGTEAGPWTEAGVWFVRVRHFGGWLRLWCDVSGQEPRCTVTVHLVLKE